MAVSSKVLHDIKFGTDGWRALIAKEFTYKNLNIFLDGLAFYIIQNYGLNKPLVLGYDARFLADRFASFAALVMNSWGIKVILIDHPVPTPVIAFAAREQGSCGALTFTASHNPPEYMGIKYIPEYAGPASLEITNKILEQVESVSIDPEVFKQKAFKQFAIEVATDFDKVFLDNLGEIRNIQAKFYGSVTKLNPRESYIKHLSALINFDEIKKQNQKKKTKLVYDPLFGCGLSYADKLLREAGFDLITLHDRYDPTFGGSLPDPTERRLQELKQTIIQTGSQLGAANDGDADRFAFMDEAGVFYPANKSLPIILKYLVEHRGLKGSVARTIATTHLLDDIAAKFNLKTYETVVGFKWLCEVMRREDTLLAAEESGGMSILRHIPEKDGILAILLLAEVLAVTGKKLSQLWQEAQDFVGKQYFYDRLDLHLDEQTKKSFMAKFTNPNLKEVAGIAVERVDLREGAKVYLKNQTWFLARPSGTEAMCRVYFESNDHAELAKTVKIIGAMI